MKANEFVGRGEKLARGLGWFSIALGMTEILVPRQLSRFIGVEERPNLMRALGVREALSGIGILAQERPEAALWSRVAGDGIDLGLLGAALRSSSQKGRVLAATTAVAGVTALDTLCAIQCTASVRVRFAESVDTVNAPQAEVYAFWRDEKNLPKIFKFLPTKLQVVASRPDEFIELRSTDGVLVRSASIAFTPAFGRDGTEVRIDLDGRIPTRLLHEDLRRAKRLIETGEIPTTEGQSAGPRATALAARLIHRLEGKEVA